MSEQPTPPGLTEAEIALLQSFENEIEFAEFGRDEIEQRQHNTWRLGDIVAQFAFRVGRPKKGDENTPRQADLADAWGYSTGQVGQWGKTAAFYPRNVRTRKLNWSVYDAARKEAEYRTDELEEQIDLALEWLDTAIDLHIETVRDFNHWVQGVYYEGPLQGLLPSWIIPFVPKSAKELWIVLRERRKEDKVKKWIRAQDERAEKILEEAA
jgi:hypothetical protein